MQRNSHFFFALCAFALELLLPWRSTAATPGKGSDAKPEEAGLFACALAFPGAFAKGVKALRLGQPLLEAPVAAEPDEVELFLPRLRRDTQGTEGPVDRAGAVEGPEEHVRVPEHY